MTQSEAGKGSKRRPAQVSDERLTENWSGIAASAGYCIHGKRLDDSCKFCNPPKDPNPYRKYWKCDVCNGEVHDHICEELLRQQVDRT
jgi:hypothetical protein